MTGLFRMPIQSLILSPRTDNSLRRARITDVLQILSMTEDELLALPDFGQESLLELDDQLRRCGVLPYPDEMHMEALPGLQDDLSYDLSPAERDLARARAREVARGVLGEQVWMHLERRGFVDVPSGRIPGRIYRLRPGRRVELRETDATAPSRFMCVYPLYELPADEFLAQLYLYLRDREEHVLLTGNVTSYDAPTPNVF